MTVKQPMLCLLLVGLAAPLQPATLSTASQHTSAKTLMRQANMAFNKEDHTSAAKLGEQALDILNEIYPTYHEDTFKVYNLLTKAYLEQKDYAKALDRAKEGWRAVDVHHGKSHMYKALFSRAQGAIHEERGNYKQALIDYAHTLGMIQNVSEKLRKEVRKLPLYGSIHRDMGRIHAAQGNPEKASELFFESLSAYTQMYKGKHRDIAITMHEQNKLYATSGQHSEAYKACDKLIKYLDGLAPDDGLRWVRLETYQNLAAHCMGLGKLQEALKWCQESIKIHNEIPEAKRDQEMLGNSYKTKGVLHQAEGDNDEALRCYDLSLRCYRNVYGTEPNMHMVLILFNQAVIEASLKQHTPRVLTRYLESLEMHTKLPPEEIDKDMIASTYKFIGGIYLSHGTIDQALQAFEASITWRSEIRAGHGPNVKLAREAYNLANLYLKLERYDQASKYYQQSIDHFGNNLMTPEDLLCAMNARKQIVWIDSLAADQKAQKEDYPGALRHYMRVVSAYAMVLEKSKHILQDIPDIVADIKRLIAEVNAKKEDVAMKMDPMAVKKVLSELLEEFLQHGQGR